MLLSAYGLVRAAQLAQRRLPLRVASPACVVGAALVLAPAALFDARALTRPATARYPGLDHWQYVTGWTAGGPWRDAAELIRRRGTGRQVVILTPGAYEILRLALDDDGRYIFAEASSPLAAKAQLAVVDTIGSPVDPRGFRAQLNRRKFVAVRRFSRPNASCSELRERLCGGSVIVSER